MRGKIFAVVLLMFTLAGCGKGTASGPAASDPATSPGDFVRHANAVQAATSDGAPTSVAGIRRLVPVGQCAIGVGTYQNGYRKVGANWTGDADCTSFKLPDQRAAPSAGDRLPSQGGWDGSEFSASSAIGFSDGSVIGVDSALHRLDPDGTVTALADLHLPWRDPKQETGDTGSATAIVQSGDRLLIGGGQVVNSQAGPLMWSSTDGGKTVTPVRLPLVKGYVGAMAASDSAIVAAEQSGANGRLGAWRSTDGGQTWQLAEFSTGGVIAVTTNVLRTEHGWLIVGYGQGTQTPFLASSADGVNWKVIDTSAMGAGVVVDATGAKSDDLVLVGQVLRGGGKPDCGVLWTGPADGMRRVDLGCEDAPSAAATLADGRVIVVGSSSVWVRA